MNADRRLVGAVADHRDDLPVAEALAAADELLQQPLADAAPGHVVSDVDRVLQRIAVGAASTIGRAVAIARNVHTVFLDQVRQAAPYDIAIAARELLDRRRLLLE